MRTLQILSTCRFLSYGLAVALMGGASIMVSAAHAQGSSPDVLCTGSVSNTYSPGLTNSSQSVNYTSNSTFACTSPPTVNSELTGGQSASGGTAALSCLSLLTLGVEDRVVTYHWNDGTTTTVSYVLDIGTTVDGTTQLIETGTGTSGTAFVGAAFTLTSTIADALLNNCGTAQGQISAAGSEALTVSPALL